MPKPQAVITDPKLIQEYNILVAKFDEPGTDGSDLFMKVRDLLIRQGELNFEEEIKEYPYGLEVVGLGTHDFAGNKETAIRQWLNDNCNRRDFIYMPKHVIGKYKDYWNWIYFRKSTQAVLFKLTWG